LTLQKTISWVDAFAPLNLARAVRRCALEDEVPGVACVTASNLSSAHVLAAMTSTYLGPFRDSPESRFYQARDLSPEETWQATTKELARALTGVRVAMWGRPLEMNIERLLRWHGALFGRLFPYEAAHLRRAHEPAQFGVPVMQDGERSIQAVDGAPSDQLRRLLNESFAAYAHDSQALRERTDRPPIREFTRLGACLYIDLLRIHPFTDGNHRTSFIALSGVFWSFQVPAVRFPTNEDMLAHDDAVALGVLHLDLEPFANLLEERLIHGRSA
jgi:fido (protein-threonine AMPylation protein)